MPYRVNEDQMGWEALTSIEPGMHFMLSDHTLEHCRDAFVPLNFARPSRDDYEKGGKQGLMDRVRESYREIMARDNPAAAPPELAGELDALVAAADKKLSL